LTPSMSSFPLLSSPFATAVPVASTKESSP
jgi:hypothetical protein